MRISVWRDPSCSLTRKNHHDSSNFRECSTGSDTHFLRRVQDGQSNNSPLFLGTTRVSNLQAWEHKSYHQEKPKPKPANLFMCFLSPISGPCPQYGWHFPEKFRKNSGKTPETLSERFLEFPSRVRLGCPKPYNSSHLRLPEHFQNGDASFFRSGSGEGLPEPVMEFPRVLGVFMNKE